MGVYPACAGIDLYAPCAPLNNVCLPRMRGDRPRMSGERRIKDEFTPHARGSTDDDDDGKTNCRVYPACAGIDLHSVRLMFVSASLPRMRGDRPVREKSFLLRFEFTPHARGSTVHKDSERRSTTVYPACAGIDPGSALPPGKSPGLPRMRGDRPPEMQDIRL